MRTLVIDSASLSDLWEHLFLFICIHTICIFIHITSYLGQRLPRFFSDKRNGVAPLREKLSSKLTSRRSGDLSTTGLA